MKIKVRVTLATPGVNVHTLNVDVSYKSCAKKSCFRMMQDKGTFVQGRGYTQYYKNPQWVCGTRHLHGCPTTSQCRICHIKSPEGEVCPHCRLVPSTPK
jgi:hypothetical protein